MADKRGECPLCHRSARLRADEMTGAHGTCPGSGQPPVPFDPSACGACMEHRFNTPGLTEACFSVAIESRATAEALMWDYLVEFHDNGHKEPA